MQNIETLIIQAENIAKEKADGHLSILKFTTGWKIFLGTPNLDRMFRSQNRVSA